MEGVSLGEGTMGTFRTVRDLLKVTWLLLAAGSPLRFPGGCVGNVESPV